MARWVIDRTANEDFFRLFGKIDDNFGELYANDAAQNTSITTATLNVTGTATVSVQNVTNLETVGSFKLGTGTKTGTSTAGAVTLNTSSGVITTEALATAALGTYTLTITNSTITAVDQVMASLCFGTNTTGNPFITTVTPGAGTVVIKVYNADSVNALNGTLKITFMVMKA